MNAAKLIFRIAGSWGLLILTPIFFLRDRIAVATPPAITHPEYFFGFLCTAFIFQLLFFFIAADPIRFRPLMPLAMLEKFGYAIFVFWLTATHQSPSSQAIFAAIDTCLGLLFLFSYLKTPRTSGTSLQE